MLERQREYWRKKAQEEYLQADNEAKAQEELQRNQFDFNKKLREQGWALKGLQSADDQTLQNRLTHAQHTKHTRKYGEIDIESPAPHPHDAPSAANQNQDQGRSWFRFFGRKEQKPPAKNHSNNQHGHDSQSVAAKSTGESVFDDYSVHRIKLRYTLLDGKQNEAHALFEADANNKRYDFLKENYERIVMLRRVKTWLGVSKQPPHHMSAAHQLPGFDPAEHQCILTEEEMDRLRCSIPVIPPERIIEELKPLEQVIAEENEANRFRIGGMHHRYMGAEKLYPLKDYPSTIEALLPPYSQDHRVPEHHLLPNPAEEARIRAEQEAIKARKREKRRQLRNLRKEKVDLTRTFVRPSTAPGAMQETMGDGTMGDPSFVDAHAVRYTNDPRHSATSSTAASPKRINRQFHWRPKIFAGTSPQVVPLVSPHFQHDARMSIFAEDSRDLSTIPAPVEDVDGDVDGGGTFAIGGDSFNGGNDGDGVKMQLASPVKRKPTTHVGAMVTGESVVSEGDRPFYGSAGSAGVGNQTYDTRPHTAPAQHDSYLATRSDVFASTSFVPGKPLVRIKLPKYRKFQSGERKLKIRGGLKMISLRGKEKLLTEVD